MTNRTVTPAELLEWLRQGRTIQLLDVRKRQHFDADPRLLPHAKWLDPQRVDEWWTGLPRTAPIIVYCVHGHTVSNGVVDSLRARGFDACLIEGGIEAWKQAGGPTTEDRTGV